MWAFRRISTWQRAGVTNALVALAVRQSGLTFPWQSSIVSV